MTDYPPPDAGQRAMFDQTNALIVEVVSTIINHWPTCQLSPDDCIGANANAAIVHFASRSADQTRALLFLSIIYAAKEHADNIQLREQVLRLKDQLIDQAMHTRGIK